MPSQLQEIPEFDVEASSKDELIFHLGKGFTRKAGNIFVKRALTPHTRYYMRLGYSEKRSYAKQLHEDLGGVIFVRLVKFKDGSEGWYNVGENFDQEQRFRDCLKNPPGLMKAPECKKVLKSLGFRASKEFITFLYKCEVS